MKQRPTKNGRPCARRHSDKPLGFVLILLGLLLALLLGSCGSSTNSVTSALPSANRSAAAAEAILWSEAVNHVGETVTIKGPVISASYAGTSNGAPTFLNIGRDYPDPDRFTVVIWGADRGSFPAAPESMYEGKTIRVTGSVSNYEGHAQIEVTSPTAIAVVPAAPTSNGWHAQDSAASGCYFSAVAFPDPDHSWAVGGTVVGANGTIMATSDGGTTWNVQPAGATANLLAVAFPDPDHGWAVGSGGAILATSDGGGAWRRQTSGAKATLQAVAFPDADHGWAVGEISDSKGNVQSNVILATSDSGATWDVQSNAGTPYNLSGVAFSDDSHGWVVGWDAQTGSGVVLATTNGGATWKAQNSRVTSRTGLIAVTFLDDKHGWAVGWGLYTGTGIVLATANGGVTWKVQLNAKTTQAFLAVTFPDAMHGWAVGWNGTIFATTNGGATWKAQSSGVTANLYGVAFPDAMHGCVVGMSSDSQGNLVDSVLLTTSNGGVKW